MNAGLRVCLGTLLLAGSAAAQSVNWPQFHLNNRHTGFNRQETTLNPGNVSHLALAWTGVTRGIVDFSSPAVVDGMVYVGAQDGLLYAFQAAGCGNPMCPPVWTGQTGGSVYSSPAVANGVVYIGTQNHQLFVFDAAGCGSPTCAPLWTGTVAGSILQSSPAVANGVVYAGSYDGKLYAFAAAGCGQATCAPLWTAATASNITSSPAVANGVVYIGSADHHLYALRPPDAAAPPALRSGPGSPGVRSMSPHPPSLTERSTSVPSITNSTHSPPGAVAARRVLRFGPGQPPIPSIRRRQSARAWCSWARAMAC